MPTSYFETIRVEGGLLSIEYLHTVLRTEASAQKSSDYGVPAGHNLRGEIARAWKIARTLRKEKQIGELSSGQFIKKFLHQVLGFTDLQEYTSVNAGHYHTGDSHQPTHLAKNGVIPIVIAPTDDGLDSRQQGLLANKEVSPFNLAQIHLNSSEKHLWGIVCDGNTLRLLRDSASMTISTYIEADLQRILEEGEGGHYSDFSLLYLIAHISRFINGADCPLEQWREKSMQTGIRAHNQLRNGVERALEILGSGFLRHPDNQALCGQFSDNGKIDEYYRELLWLVYRMIFMLVTEERDLLQRADAREEQKKVYYGGYSISRLRERTKRLDIVDEYSDLWEGMKYTFNALHGDSIGELLGLPRLGGLFEEERCQTLQSSRLANHHLLRAIYYLSWIKDDKRLTRVNYRDMGADELGSIYESLLELTPRCDMEGNFSFFHPSDLEGGGNERKTTGSYYTSPGLVEELIKSTLQPKLDNIHDEEVLLDLRVLDPACGSGHFLLAAAHRMAEKLVAIRGIDNENLAAEHQQRRLALRDVISHCICGVDKNPMALDLAKTALWLEAFDAEKPLVFLDHHLQCGDSLLGVLNLDLLEKGIPDEAYTHAYGDCKKTCSDLKRSNRRERQQHKKSTLFATQQVELADEAAQIEVMPEDDLVQVAEKRKAYYDLEEKRNATGIHVAADMFVVAFLLSKSADQPRPPTSSDLFTALVGSIAHDDATIDVSHVCASSNRVFHWWLRYPAIRAQGGFDVILANPPWERIELQEIEFYSRRDPRIARAANQSIRKEMIARLGKEENDSHGRALKQAHTVAKHVAETSSCYVRKSGNYPLTGRGKVNTYALFAELCLRLTSSGSAGIIVPSGISTDNTTKTYFSYLVKNKLLRSLYDFENRQGLFPNVHRMFRFSLLSIASSEQTDSITFAHSVADLRDERRRIALTSEQLQLVNPNTHTMPLYRTGYDCKLCEKIYHVAPILWREDIENGNSWQVKFQNMFNMSTDSGLFKQVADFNLVRLYEAKYMHQYDHRWAINENNTARVLEMAEKQPDFTIATRYYVQESIMLARVANIPDDLRKAVENDNGRFWCIVRDWLIGNFTNQIDELLPRLPLVYTSCREEIDMKKALVYAQQIPLRDEDIEDLLQAETINELLRKRSPKWLMGWRDITNVTNQFTLISSILPLLAAGGNINIMYSAYSDIDKQLLLYSMLNSLIINYTVRQKLSGSHLDPFRMKQLPILPPEAFTEEDIQAIVPAVLELTYTAHDLKPFYDDIVGQNPAYDWRPSTEQGKPFGWDEVRRAELRAAIDARIAIKYGITRDELRYILDPADIMGDDYPSETFRILKNNEIEQYGEYRTRRLVLEAYDSLTQSGVEKHPISKK